MPFAAHFIDPLPVGIAYRSCTTFRVTTKKGKKGFVVDINYKRELRKLATTGNVKRNSPFFVNYCERRSLLCGSISGNRFFVRVTTRVHGWTKAIGRLWKNREFNEGSECLVMGILMIFFAQCWGSFFSVGRHRGRHWMDTIIDYVDKY